MGAPSRRETYSIIAARRPLPQPRTLSRHGGRSHGPLLRAATTTWPEHTVALCLHVRQKAVIYMPRHHCQAAAMTRFGNSNRLRIGRCSLPGTIYFLTTATAERRPLFAYAPFAQIVLSAIRWLNEEQKFDVHAAVVMPDHVHIAGALGNGSLASTMHSLKSFTAHQIISRGVAPPIWQSGYHDHALRDDEDYRACLTYLLQNPIRAGLCDDLEHYPFLLFPEWWRE